MPVIGSIVEDGEGVMLVQRIGTETVYGEIMKDINADDEEERKSPLEVKLSNLAEAISRVGYLGATFIFLSFLFKQFVMDQGYSWERTVAYVFNWKIALHDTVTALILAIIIIVVAVPEVLLPAPRLPCFLASCIYCRVSWCAYVSLVGFADDDCHRAVAEHAQATG